MLKLCRVTKVKLFFLVLVYVFNCDLFEFSAAILEKGLLKDRKNMMKVQTTISCPDEVEPDVFLFFTKNPKILIQSIIKHWLHGLFAAQKVCRFESQYSHNYYT